MEEPATPELISPRISFSYDLAAAAATPAAQPALLPGRRSDTSLLMARRLPEPEFDFANAAAEDVAPADRLFAGGRLLPVPPLPPSPGSSRGAKPGPPCRHQASAGGGGKPQQPACGQKRPGGSWTSAFSRSSSVNSATTSTSAASGRFRCASFSLMRSRSTGSAAAAAAHDGLSGSVAASHRPPHKKAGATAATACNAAGPGGGVTRSAAYYYGGSRNGSNSHGVRVSPILNVPSIGTSVVNVLSYLLCDCGNKTTKSRGFGVNC